MRISHLRRLIFNVITSGNWHRFQVWFQLVPFIWIVAFVGILYHARLVVYNHGITLRIVFNLLVYLILGKSSCPRNNLLFLRLRRLTWWEDLLKDYEVYIWGVVILILVEVNYQNLPIFIGTDHIFVQRWILDLFASLDGNHFFAIKNVLNNLIFHKFPFRTKNLLINYFWLGRCTKNLYGLFKL